MSTNKILLRAVLLVCLTTISAMLLSAQQIVGSDRHASILCADGAVFSWGENRDGLLGDGTTIESNAAVRTIVSEIASLTGRYSGVVAVDKNGNVFAWGGVEQNQFGMPSWGITEPMPKSIPYASGVKKAVANNGNAYFLLDDGRLMVCGKNSRGQYGNGSTTRIDTGWSMVSIDSVVDIFCAASAAFAVRADGTIWAWGSNQGNQIDSTSEPHYVLPKVILRTNGITSTSGTPGYSNFLGSMRVVTTNGDVYVWGQNDKNQLGVPDQMWVRTPTKLTLPRKVIAVSGGLEHTILLCNDGTVWAWGDNNFGQLGNPFQRNSVEPVQVIGLSDVVAIGSGSYSSYAITRSGALFGWGDNTYRQLNLDNLPLTYSATALILPCSLVSSAPSFSEHAHVSSKPNPVNDILTVGVIEGTTMIEVFNIQGQLVHTLQAPLTETEVKIDLASEPRGVYTIIRTRGSDITSEMVIKL